MFLGTGFDGQSDGSNVSLKDSLGDCVGCDNMRGWATFIISAWVPLILVDISVPPTVLSTQKKFKSRSENSRGDIDIIFKANFES